jgi:hypothetical protein
MGIAIKNVRNWGVEQQRISLFLTLKRKRLVYKVIKNDLFVSPSYNGVTLPFCESVAYLVHIKRCHWESHHPLDGRRLARGCSLIDVIFRTIDQLQ